MSGIIARNPTAGEVDKAAEIAFAAFGHSGIEHWQRSFHQIADIFGLRYILVVECDGELVSSLVCTPGPVFIAGRSVPHSAVGNVGTLPEYRTKGCAGAMMTRCVEMLREEGIYLSSLWPFSYNYYRKFGWEVGAEIRAFSADGRVFAEMGDASQVRGYAPDDLPAIKQTFRSYAMDLNCATDRSDMWWQGLDDQLHMLKFEEEAGFGVAVHNTDGEVDAYAVYEIAAGDTPSINVKEAAFEFPQHRRDILAFLGAMKPDARLTFSAPSADLFLQELPNPRVVQASVVPSFQFRVIDPAKAIEALVETEDPCLDGRFTLAISDPVFKQGFEIGVQVTDGIISTCKPSAKGRIEMDIQTFARIYSGYLSALDAWGLDRVKIEESAFPALELANEVFSPLTPYRSGIEPG